MPLMHGKAFDKKGAATGKVVEREVADNDVHAYLQVGYQLGPMPGKDVEEPVEPALGQVAEVEEVKPEEKKPVEKPAETAKNPVVVKPAEKAKK